MNDALAKAQSTQRNTIIFNAEALRGRGFKVFAGAALAANNLADCDEFAAKAAPMTKLKKPKQILSFACLAPLREHSYFWLHRGFEHINHAFLTHNDGLHVTK